MANTFKKWWAENEERYDRIKDDRHYMIYLFEDCWEEAQRAVIDGVVRPLTSTESEEMHHQLSEMARGD